MEASNSSRTQMQVAGRAAHKFNYSAPASPIALPGSPVPAPSSAAMTPAHANSSPASGAAAAAVSSALLSNLSTPKKHLLDAVMLQRIREKLRSPGGAGELPALWNQLECTAEYEPVNVIKDRYLISTQPHIVSAAAAAKTPASYRHLIDLTCSNLKCTDVFTEEQFLCKIINEPLHKVQRAYFQLQQEGDRCCSTIYDHPLIRGVHDIVPLSKQRTYVIIAAAPTIGQRTQAIGAAEEEEQCGIYEDLHTYIRNKRRLCESEARALFHQICQTVQVCHRNGIILRDLKLKRFYFIDEARTKLQYESLEGSMILDDPANDTLSDKIGCPLYTAPELLCPNPTYHGKPADMWSLGVILYTMLVGQYPFYEKGNCNLITVIRHCNVQIPSNLSRSVRSLLLALLRKNYEERMPAEYIFYSPWLREQRAYYMYIPVDVYIPDDEEEQAQQQAAEASDVPLVATCAEEQPLDYTCTALQMECDSNSSQGGAGISSDGDVEMG